MGISKEAAASIREAAEAGLTGAARIKSYTMTDGTAVTKHSPKELLEVAERAGQIERAAQRGGMYQPIQFETEE